MILLAAREKQQKFCCGNTRKLEKQTRIKINKILAKAK